MYSHLCISNSSVVRPLVIEQVSFVHNVVVIPEVSQNSLKIALSFGPKMRYRDEPKTLLTGPLTSLRTKPVTPGHSCIILISVSVHVGDSSSVFKIKYTIFLDALIKKIRS